MSWTRETLKQYWDAFMPEQSRTTLRPVVGERIDKNASQSDKPSPTSSYSERDLLKKLRGAFPECRVMTVQNTNSMEPFVDAGDIVVLEKDPKDVRVMDVVAYQHESYIVLHRVVEIKNGRMRIKGDNNFLSDGWIEPSAIKYRLCAVGWGRKNTND